MNFLLYVDNDIKYYNKNHANIIHLLFEFLPNLFSILSYTSRIDNTPKFIYADKFVV